MRGLKSQLSNVATPKLDLAGCVFYLPFWSPDMVARGGSIVSGTGTMAVTPLNLAVGANTITALTAGTFIITVPQAGTCASVGGGATITGSPVTLPAGVATTVTTGVTTGNFTVTTSNIIRSKDSTRHLCTVSGATWGSQGRSFDGSDDLINIPASTSINNLSAFTLIAWIKPTTLGELSSGRLFHKASDAGNVAGWFLTLSANNRLNVNIAYATTNNNATSPVNSITLGSWQMGAVTWGGNAAAATVLFYINGILVATTAVSDGTGARSDDSTSSLSIGNRVDAGRSYDGIIGETLIYNRVLTAGEIQRNYLTTKFRY